ncbi:hypothetical protein [Natrarchaeobius chitinivorans]|uniref:Uncharacterized protein n=1 Tax=Natrarchaeobius chitinivorans TaxID=1679083 RepID=A0A3N6MG77_NATCH|nr:hypothetical protein [Natrarchaeobius chitinivorans]RQG94621.1 hypothetical protein EA473_11090 [Natrarchaeobius chitinivorans]
MNVRSHRYETVLGVQVLGTIIFGIGLLQGGLTPLTVFGAVIIFLSIVALALEAAIGEPVGAESSRDDEPSTNGVLARVKTIRR